MPRIMFSSPENLPLSHLFIIDHNVGRHGANHRHDVLLVQFFLRAVLPAPLPGQPLQPIDGVCGQQTVDAIRYFQTAQLRGVAIRESAARGDRNPRQSGSAGGSDGSVRFVSSNSRIGTGRITDGTSNTLLVGEQPPAEADQHVQQHYGRVQAPHRSEPLHGGMTIVQLNLAYLRACGGARFKSLDHDPSFPGELSPAFYGSISGGLNIQGAQNNLRQIGI